MGPSQAFVVFCFALLIAMLEVSLLPLPCFERHVCVIIFFLACLGVWQ